ncbi:Gti1/Pac2 family protein [Colletotrichum tabaci]|uniref:Gti1/Pac2 family protein n=1 Tax=Colletotrichum tabaci TaxID=1209068 RepID=A0AAV9T1I5_9PEZI
MANSNVPLNPTFFGHVASTLDALVLFEACLSSALHHVPRRPHDRERQDLIKSGNVFIYEEHSSGIKRWTDGVAWSPSRILGNFLIYRELDRPFPPGEKKRAMKRNKKPTGVTKPEITRQGSVNGAGANMGIGDGSQGNKEAERALIGSLVDSYPFKENGLVKKTISVTYQGVPHHLVSYYNVEDVTEGKLMTPSKDHQLSTIIPRGELIMSQNFRAPIDEVEMDDSRGPHGLFTHAYPVNGHHHQSLSRAITASKIAAKLPTLPKNIHEDIRTLPNLLTLSRLVAAPFVGYFILHDQHAWALGLFAYAGVTDLLDGWIARRWKQQTVVGTVIDPMADKMLMTILTVCLAAQGSLPVWLATIILGRDVGLAMSAIYYRWISLPPPKTFARYWDFSLPSAEVRPTTISKYNTFLQLVLIGMTTAAPVFSYDISTPLTIMQYIVAITTVWSGASYIYTKDAVKILTSPKTPPTKG